MSMLLKVSIMQHTILTWENFKDITNVIIFATTRYMVNYEWCKVNGGFTPIPLTAHHMINCEIYCVPIIAHLTYVIFRHHIDQSIFIHKNTSLNLFRVTIVTK